MSSGNLVSVIYAPESEYNKKDEPISGVVAETTRFTSESLSGTPNTTESAAIRQDRMSGGQVVTGLEVGGDLPFELASGTYFDDFFEAGMMNSWVAQASLSTDVTLTPDPADDQKATLTITGDLSTIGDGVAANDVLQLIPASGSPVTVSVISVTDANNCEVATKRGELAIVGDTMTLAVPAHLEIGDKQTSFTIGKSYTDVQHDVTTDDHSQTYTGSLVSGFTIAAAYGEIVTGSFLTQGAGYEQENPSYEQQIVAGGGTVNPAEVSQPVNASIDVPLVTTDGLATSFCIESFGITLDNGLTPQNCIGKIAPTGYDLGTAAIAIDASIYLSDPSYDAFLPGKLSQTPISMTFNMTNSDGGWAFHLAAVQLSFADPSSEGQNTQTMIEASGTAKVGATGESAIVIYKLVGDQ